MYLKISIFLESNGKHQMVPKNLAQEAEDLAKVSFSPFFYVLTKSDFNWLFTLTFYNLIRFVSKIFRLSFCSLGIIFSLKAISQDNVYVLRIMSKGQNYWLAITIYSRCIRIMHFYF